MIWVKRLLFIPGLVLVLVTALIVVSMTWLCYTEAGLNAIASVVTRFEPRLRLQQPAGSLLGTPRFAAVVWDQGDVVVTVSKASTQLSPSCLLRFTVCAEALAAHAVIIDLHASENAESDDSAALPEVSLPFRLAVNSTQLQTLQINRDDKPVFAAEQLSVKAFTWQRSKLAFKPLQATLYNETVTATGNIKLSKSYPISATLTAEPVIIKQLAPYIQHDPQQTPDNRLSAELSGSLQQLSLSFALQGLLNLEGTAQFSPIDEQLPFAATLNSLEAVVLSINNQSFDISSSALSLAGNRAGLSLDADSSLLLPGMPTPTALQLLVNSDYERITIEQLIATNARASLRATGEALLEQQSGHVVARLNNVDPSWIAPDWPGQINAESRITFTDLFTGPVFEVEVSSLSGQLNNKPFSSQGSMVVYSDQRIRFDEWLLTHESDSLSIRGTFPEQTLRWSANISAIQAYVSNAAGQFSASGQLSGSLNKPTLKAQLDGVQLAYENFRADTLTAKLDINQLAWSDSLLVVEAGGFDIGSGQVPIDIAMTIAAVQSGKSSVTAPSFLTLGKKLAADASIQLKQQQNWQSQLSCQADIQLDSLSISNRCEQWSVAMNKALLQQQAAGNDADQAQPNNASETAANDGQWLNWRLDNPIELHWQSANRQLRSNNFCLRHDSSSLCVTGDANWQANQAKGIAFSGAQLPLQWFAVWLPASYQLTGEWNFEARLQEPPASASAASSNWHIQGDLNTQDAVLSLHTVDTPPLVLPIETLQLVFNGATEALKADFILESKQLGTINGQLNYQNQQLNAQLLTRQLDLQPLEGLFPDVSLLTGQLSTDLKLHFEADALTLTGDTVINNLAVNSRALPFDFTDGGITLRFSGNQFSVDSTIKLGQGNASITGNGQWAGTDWNADLLMTASEVRIEPLAKSYALLSSELTLSLTPSEAVVGGQITIPKARIELEKLPQNAVSVSDDTVIENEVINRRSMVIKADVKTQLGDDVKFRGFGLETQLTGHLRIQQKPGQLLSGNGVVNLIDGRYRAYGQDLLIEEGRMIFAGPLSNPQLFVTAIRNHTEDDVRVGVQATGSAKEPKLTLFSNPNMSEQNVLYYLLTGKGPDDSSVDQSRLAQQTAIALGLAQSNKRAREIGQSIGVSDFQMGTDIGKNGEEAQFSGYITPDLFLLYGVSIFDQLSSITARYELTPDIYIEVYNSTSSAIDVFWSIVKH